MLNSPAGAACRCIIANNRIGCVVDQDEFWDTQSSEYHTEAVFGYM